MRRGIRLRKAVPRFPAGPLPGPGCPRRPEAPDPGRAVRRVKWLTPGGLVAACAVGAGVTWGLRWPGLALLAAFFLTGSILTQLAERRGPSRNARQGKYECPACDARFERGSSVCHEPVRLARGWRWVDNDGVNLAATLVGAAAAMLGSHGPPP